MKLRPMNLISVATIAAAACMGGCPFSRSRQKADMTGGRYIVYRIDGSRVKPEDLDELTRKTIEVLKKRIERDNVLRLAWIDRGSGTFEVQIPVPDETVRRKYEALEESKKQLVELGIEEGEAWRYYLREEIPKEVKKDRAKNAALKKYFKALDKYSPYMIAYDPAENRFKPEYVKFRITQAGRLDFRVLPTPDHPETNVEEVKRLTRQLETDGPAKASDEDYVWCEIRDVNDWNIPDSIVGSHGDRRYVLASNVPEECMLSGPEATWKVHHTSRAIDRMGRRAVNLTFDENGSESFGALTGKNIDRPLCILLDDIALNAPRINQRIYGKVMVTGDFNIEEQSELVHLLGAGVLSVKIFDTPVSEGIVGDEEQVDVDDHKGEPNR